jgi:DNA-binding response OmpR family regulator
LTAEVPLPTRSVRLRRPMSAPGRLLWRCQGRSRPPRRPEPDAAGGSASPAPQTTRRVLVIDDERSIRMLCRVNLAASGMEVLEAPRGDEGFELARREQPDLILLDVMMPGQDGWSVARALAENPLTREIPIVFLTARADAADRRLGQQLGGVGYVVKPFDPVRIADLVEEVLERVERGEREQLRREITAEAER